jgi:hypothetical protein
MLQITLLHGTTVLASQPTVEHHPAAMQTLLGLLQHATHTQRMACKAWQLFTVQVDFLLKHMGWSSGPSPPTLSVSNPRSTAYLIAKVPLAA